MFQDCIAIAVINDTSSLSVHYEIPAEYVGVKRTRHILKKEWIIRKDKKVSYQHSVYTFSSAHVILMNTFQHTHNVECSLDDAELCKSICKC